LDENEKEKMWNENPEYNLKDLKKSEYNFEGLSVEDREFLMIDLNWILFLGKTLRMKNK